MLTLNLNFDASNPFFTKLVDYAHISVVLV